MCPGNHCVDFFSGKTNSFRNFFFNSGKIACHRTEFFIELTLNVTNFVFLLFSRNRQRILNLKHVITLFLTFCRLLSEADSSSIVNRSIDVWSCGPIEKRQNNLTCQNLLRVILSSN
jgi:hypothetical protein